jgi:hypothetical protein
VTRSLRPSSTPGAPQRVPPHQILRPFTRAFPALLLLFLVLGGTAACEDSSPSTAESGGEVLEVGVVVNSIDQTLTIFDPEEPESPTRTVDLDAGGDGTPVAAALQGRTALVPMGVYPAAQVIDLDAGEVIGSIALPAGSGATGALFLTDSTALVANPGLGTVSHVNVRAGTVLGEIDSQRRYPQGFLHIGAQVLVINGELENFVPTGPGTVTVLDATSLAVQGVIELSGLNPSSGAVTSDGRVFILNGGSFGEGNGSLSEVDPSSLEEVGHHPGFGDLPGNLVASDGLLHAASWSFGIIVWDPVATEFIRNPDSAVAPDGVAATSGLGVDGQDRLYALFPDCQNPSRVLRLGSDYSVRAEFPTGICPTGVAFTLLGHP